MFHTNHCGTLEYLTADALEGSVHCFTTRHGGVSEGYLSSLNLGVHRGDQYENVLKNYEILGNALGFTPEQTVFPMQRHTDTIRVADESHRGQGLFTETPDPCDGQITDRPGVALVTFAADCAPILLFDPVRRAIGAVHAGWRGTAQGIAYKAVQAMKDAFGCDPANIQAAIGPCIGRCCFETDWDVPQAMLDALGSRAMKAITQKGEKYYVDNKFLNALWLQDAGIGGLDISPDCTYCQPDRFWSHRVTNGDRGSQAGIIMLK